MRWLPEFALRYEEYAELQDDDAVEKIGAAAASVYQTSNFKSRGELGELLLHMLIRETFNTIPAISKIYFKDSPNVTVKGFDCVHVRLVGSAFELWLGEAKLYSNLRKAARAVAQELHDHTQAGYLRSEFAAIMRKLDATWPHSEQLAALLDTDRSLDEIFETICIPVLLTYNSDAVASHDRVCSAYETAFAREVKEQHAIVTGHEMPAGLSVQLLLLPLNTRAVLATEFNRRLKACQQALG